MNKIKTVKIKNEDGSISEESYNIAIDARNVDMDNNKDLQQTIGNIDVDNDGSIEEQLKKLNEKDNNMNEKFSINCKYPLRSGGETATVNSVTNITDFTPPIAVTSIDRALEYKNFDNVGQEIGIKDKSSRGDETKYYNGLVRTVSAVSEYSVTISNSLPNNYIQKGMFIVLANTTPTNSNWTYVGQITDYNKNTNIIYVSGWFNKTTKDMEVPNNITNAWINPTTKYYAQHFDLTKNDADKTSHFVGSQMDFYGNGGAIVGYSPVVHNLEGQIANRVRAEGTGKWGAAFRSEGNEVGTGLQIFNNIITTGIAIGENNSTITDIMKINGSSYIDGNKRFSNIGLQISNGSANANKAFWNLTSDTSLTNFSAKQYHFYYVYNSSDNTITLTGTFRIRNNQTLSKIDITSRNCVLLFAYNATNYGVISTEMENHNQAFTNNFKNDICNFSGSTNLDEIFTYHKNNAGVYYFFTTAQSTLTSTYPIYLNGASSATSVTLAARTSGSIIYNNQTRSFYINSVQP